MSDSPSSIDQDLEEVRLDLSVSFDDEGEAENIYNALRVDDDEFLKTTKEGMTVKAVVRAKTVDSARRAADDWLACLISIKGN